MSCEIEVLFTPAEFHALARRDLAGTTCVVFDILRATSSLVIALANGAAGIIPAEEISGALELRRKNPQALLAGERDGLRIGAALTGGIEFDLGNSPREFTPVTVAGKTIITTTTNGTRALRACDGAEKILAASFLNLAATAKFIGQTRPARLLLVCAGTGERTAQEDALAAGALCELLAPSLPGCVFLDSAQIARGNFLAVNKILATAVRAAENARRLLANPDLHDDVEFCLRRDVCSIVAAMGTDGVIRSI